MLACEALLRGAGAMMNGSFDGGLRREIKVVTKAPHVRPQQIVLPSRLFAEAQEKVLTLFEGRSCVTRQTCLLCDTADMSAV